MDAFTLPPGYGFRRLNTPEFQARGQGLRGLLDLLLVFEPPRTRPTRRDARYIIGADISDGIGQDRSVADVLRVQTIEEPAEQVAQFVTETTSPEDFAPILDAIGRFYCDSDGLEAQMAIETNNHGKSTQDLLQKHHGYTHFYRWQYVDKLDLNRRFSQAIGWVTTPATRPILLSRFATAIKRLDPVTNLPDILIHSPFTYEDLADFYSPTGRLADAEGTRTDDCVFSLAIAYWAAEQLFIGESEPLAERRHRLHQERQARETKDSPFGRRDYRNTDVSADEADLGLDESDYAMMADDEVAALAAETRADTD